MIAALFVETNGAYFNLPDVDPWDIHRRRARARQWRSAVRRLRRKSDAAHLCWTDESEGDESKMIWLTHLAHALRYLLLFAAADHAITVEAPYVHDERAPVAISYVAFTEPPLFDDDDDRTRTLAVLLATAREESSINVDAIGDHHNAYGLNQVWKRPDLMAPIPNTIEALRQLRISFAECKRSPFSMYLSGKCVTTGRVARQSDRRMARVGAVLAIINGEDFSTAEARR